MRLQVLISLLALRLALGVCLGSQVIYVDANRPDDSGDGLSWATAKATIQAGIDVAASGDTVIVAAGVYSGQGNIDLDCKGLSVTIRSVDPNQPETMAATIIDPNGQGRGFYFDDGEDANCVIAGLTIRNGYASGKGGAVFCYSSSPTIRDCIIYNNSAGLHGGGLFFQWSTSRVEGCVIRGNSAVLDGGGIECSSASITLRNCLVYANEALNGNGGGLDCFDVEAVELCRCVFAGNSADSGGGLYLLEASGAIGESIFWENVAGGEIALEEYYGSVSELSINYSDVRGGQADIYVGGGCSLDWGSGNMAADPCFASFDASGDANDWDFHLQSEYGRWQPSSGAWVSDANTSICIDAGDPGAMWTDEPWPNGKRANVGGYAGTNQASMSGNPADFDIDGDVDYEDFAMLGDKWGEEGNFIEDLDGDNEVELGDVAVFAEHWLWQRP